MDKLKDILMYVLALIVLLAPAILLGWIGATLLDWWGGVLGVLVGLVIFALSLNKMSTQEESDSEGGEQLQAALPSSLDQKS